MSDNSAACERASENISGSASGGEKYWREKSIESVAWQHRGSINNVGNSIEGGNNQAIYQNSRQPT